MRRRGQRYDSDDDAGMNEGRAPAQESGIKRQATDTVTTSPKKSKFGTAKIVEEKKAKDQRKQDFQEWMREDDVLWQHYPSCLVYQYKDGKFVWSTATYNDNDRLVSTREVVIDHKWGNLCFSEDGGGKNPKEKTGRQWSFLDIERHGHAMLFKTNSECAKWACQACKQFGYFLKSK